MQAKCIRSALAAAAVLLLGGCFDAGHPDRDRYEYLFADGAFQPPYTEFPSGPDRVEWKCYDGRMNRRFDCTFVHRGWDDYQYIYRRRR